MQFKDMELFRGLSAVEQSRLLGSMEKLEIAAGEMIFRQGEQGDSLYVVIAGSIELFTVDDDRREHVLTCLGEGETFGEMALLTGQPRSASARALTAAF